MITAIIAAIMISTWAREVHCRSHTCYGSLRSTFPAHGIGFAAPTDSDLIKGLAHMYVHQIIGRANSREDALEICRLFDHSLSMVQEPGYARGFCAIEPSDPLSMLIQEEWYNLAGLRSWQSTEAYRKLQQQMRPLMEGIWESIEYRASGPP